jgi:arsenite/tail-anchored protein-transporting ATPase
VNLPIYRPGSAPTTRHLFFTGKGGVGKTSLSCATALTLAQSGRRVLLVSTDPASNLDEVLATRLTNRPTPIAGAPGLDAMNVNPVAAAAAYRERLIGPMRGLLPESALRSMEEQLSGSCTVEIAAFDEFSGLIGNPDTAKAYDHIVFDTAPTGHTLRLMSLAKAWDQFLDQNTSGTSCLGPLAGLEKQRAVYEATVQTLADASATTLVLVSRPQLAALREAERTSQELRALGVANQTLIINGIFETACPEDPVARALQQRGRAAMDSAQSFIASLPSSFIPLRPINILGLDGLRVLLQGDGESSSSSALNGHRVQPHSDGSSHSVDQLPTRESGATGARSRGGGMKSGVGAAAVQDTLGCLDARANAGRPGVRRPLTPLMEARTREGSWEGAFSRNWKRIGTMNRGFRGARRPPLRGRGSWKVSKPSWRISSNRAGASS